jgi:hypothetical protein
VKFRLGSIVVNFAPFRAKQQAGKRMAEAAGTQVRLAWLLPFAALAAGYVAGYLRREPDAHSRSHASVSVATPASRVMHAAHATLPTLTQSRTTVLPAMPPASAPLVQSFDALAVRARNGDGAAAVRLATATLHCAQRDYALGTVATMDNRPPKTADVARTKRVDRARAFIAETASLCEGATREQTGSAGEWIERAAASGDAPSQACYTAMGASEPWLPEYASDAWIDAMRRYRENARAYAESSFAAGVPQAAYSLYEMSAGRYALVPIFGDGTTAPDYARAYALARLQAARIGADAEPGSDEARAAADWSIRAKLLERELADADIERAKRWAEAEAAKIAQRGTPSLPCDGWMPG